MAVGDVSGVEDMQLGDGKINGMSRTELDSHANMPVVGKNVFVLAETGRTCDVNAFTPDYEPMKVPIVDAAVAYECPYQGTTHILVLRDCLHVPTMTNNLIPPFILREAGIEVNDRPKIQSKEPSIEDHSLYFPEAEFRIPLSLSGVFSGFVTSKPDLATLESCDDVYMLTPTQWDPHAHAWRLNEESMLDWQGEMIEKKDRQQVLLSDVKQDIVMAVSLGIGSVEACAIDSNLERRYLASSEVVRPLYPVIPTQCDQVSSVLAGINPCLNDKVLYQRLEARAQLGDFMMAAGSTVATASTDIDIDEIEVENVHSDDDDDEMDEAGTDDIDEEAWMHEIYEQGMSGKLDFDEIMSSATHAGRSQGVDAEHLSKVWRISIDEANRTLDMGS